MRRSEAGVPGEAPARAQGAALSPAGLGACFGSGVAGFSRPPAQPMDMVLSADAAGTPLYVIRVTSCQSLRGCSHIQLL